jgi:hypothetical protein
MLQNVPPVDLAEAVIAIAEFLAPDGKLLAALRSARDDAVAEQSRLAGRSVLRSTSAKSLRNSRWLRPRTSLQRNALLLSRAWPLCKRRVPN